MSVIDQISGNPEWQAFTAEVENELHRILHYWEKFSLDDADGFVGRIDGAEKRHPESPKGSVLHARILWAFSSAYRYTGEAKYLQLASRAFNYICDYLTDPDYGGLYWTVDHQGNRLESHKQVYAQAFGIYGMSEYARITGSKKALDKSITWYRLIEKYSRDRDRGGYIDAFARDWSALQNKQLSEKDENAPKTMNTHLHIAEAYANLYEVWPDQQLKSELLELLELFNLHIINKASFHLKLFFTENWQSENKLISYGHDIEAAWLLLSCAASAGDQSARNTALQYVLPITDAAMEGLDTDGGLWYEFDKSTGDLIQEKHWWPQAEALVGLMNAWQISGDDKYKRALFKNWQFIRGNISDKENGEWFWGISRDGEPMTGKDKIGLWKCPYHNTRACLELIRRVNMTVDA